eukprot:jgi/Mesvir1/16584/Mv10120-RA.1
MSYLGEAAGVNLRRSSDISAVRDPAHEISPASSADISDGAAREDPASKILHWRCGFCVAKKNRVCPKPSCHYGKVHENRAYHPWGEMDRSGTVTVKYTPEEIKADPMKFLMLTSVRCYDGADHDIVVAATMPDWYDEDSCVTATEMKTKRRKKFTRLKTAGAEKEAVRFGLHTDEGVDSSSPVHAAVETAVRSVAQTGVSRVYQRGQGVHAVYSAWTKHKFCLNVGREHASNNVWFSISFQGISQRCFDDGCAGYASDPVPIPESAHSALFRPPPDAVVAQSNQTTVSALNLAQKISAPPMKCRGAWKWKR